MLNRVHSQRTLIILNKDICMNVEMPKQQAGFVCGGGRGELDNEYFVHGMYVYAGRRSQVLLYLRVYFMLFEKKKAR